MDSPRGESQEAKGKPLLDDAKETNLQEEKINIFPQYVATVVVDLLHFIYGLAIGWPAVALPLLTAAPRPGQQGEGAALTLAQASWLTASPFAAAVPSMPALSALCERRGRKACARLIGVCFLFSSVVLALADGNYALMQVSRVAMGAGAGGIFVVAPLYVSEIAVDAARGRLGSLLVLLRSAGILFAFALGACDACGGCRRLEQVAIAFPLLFLICFFWMPETPVHLLRQGRVREAEEALLWLRGGGRWGGRAASNAAVQSELQRLQGALERTRSSSARSASIKELLATRGRRKAFLIGILLSCDQQITGFYGLMSYTFMIFDQTSPHIRDLSNVIVGVVLLVSLSICIPLYDRVPRRTLLLVSNGVMLASLLALSAYFYSASIGGDVSSFYWLPVSALSVYIVGNSMGVAALPIVILTEIFSPKVRNVALTVNSLFTWFIIFLVTKTFPALTQQVGFHGSCLFYSAWCVLGICVVVFLLPETRNRPLESILEELEHGKKNDVIEGDDSHL